MKKRIFSTTMTLILAGFALSCCNPERFAERMFEGVLEGLLQGLLGEEVEDVEIDLYPQGKEAKLPKDFPHELRYPGSVPFAAFSLEAESGVYKGMFLNLETPISDAVEYYEGLRKWDVQIEMDTTMIEVTSDTTSTDDTTRYEENIVADIAMIKDKPDDAGYWADVHIEQSDPSSGTVIILYGEGPKPESLEL